MNHPDHPFSEDCVECLCEAVAAAERDLEIIVEDVKHAWTAWQYRLEQQRAAQEKLTTLRRKAKQF